MPLPSNLVGVIRSASWHGRWGGGGVIFHLARSKQDKTRSGMKVQMGAVFLGNRWQLGDSTTTSMDDILSRFVECDGFRHPYFWSSLHSHPDGHWSATTGVSQMAIEVLLPGRHLPSSRSKSRNGDTLTRRQRRRWQNQLILISALLIAEPACQWDFPETRNRDWEQSAHLIAKPQSRQVPCHVSRATVTIIWTLIKTRQKSSWR